MGRPDPRSVRLSADLNQLIEGVSENYTAAVRILALLGLEHLGVDLRSARMDVKLALATDVSPHVEALLRDLYDRVSSGTPLPTPQASPSPVGASAPAEPEPDPGDPFASVGFDF